MLYLAFINEIIQREEIRGGELKCYRQTYRHTDRPSDEAGPRGAFAPKITGKIDILLRIFEKSAKKEE